jgi:L-fuculose-phosphate aldolase
MKRQFLSDKAAKKLICEIGKKMYSKNFVAANDGNITIRVADNAVWVTPTGVSKGDLSPEMLLKIDMQGNMLKGTWKPTSETKMHLRVYKENDDIVSTCHSHSTFAMAFSCAGVELDKAFSPEPAGVVGTVPVAPYCCPGTDELADSIAPYCKSYKVCLLANHGSLTWGTQPEEAWHRMEALEAYCKLCLIQECLMGRARVLSQKQIDTLLGFHNTGTSAINRLSGVEVATNTGPGVSLSSISTTRAEGPLGGWLSDAAINLLADKVAEKLTAKLGSR